VVNLRDVSERKRYETQLVRQALHDPLTDLPNRALLEDRLTHALVGARRERKLCGLLFLDIDQFKLVNDTAGHAAGDLLIAEMAARVSRAVRPADTVARFGGDEFAVLCEDLNDVDDALAVSARIHSQLAEPFQVGDRHLGVSVSIGVAMAEADESASALVQAADTAMYAAKERGGGCTEVFAEALRSGVVSRLDLLASLQQAVGAGELHVEYQPICSLVGGGTDIVGVEALARWRHPEHGDVTPDVFIPLAEETGLIGAIGMQVMEHAVARAQEWGLRRPGFFVSVNVSSRQISAVGFGEAVGDVITRLGADAASLMVELTEGTLIRADDTNAYNLKELDRLGIRLAIDDFGTGYSSLAYLKTLEADVLKIDGSFTRGVADDERDRSIVEAICSLGHGFGLTVVAEHVETEDQLEMLRSLGCDLAQGYLLTEPVAPEQITQLLGT
jgi:diguanylate cyclase (GGDEF)-like protein